jgi:hypothetical protein
MASFVTASKTFAERLAAELSAAGINGCHIYTEARGIGREVYQLKLFRESDVLDLCRWMYDGVAEEQRLNRKYDTYRRAAELARPTIGARHDRAAAPATGTHECAREHEGQPSVPAK